MPGAADASDRLAEGDLVERFARLAGSGPIALGVSGGSDSAALMYIAACWRTAGAPATPPITVLTVDHQLRQASAAEAQTVRQQAHALGLRHETLVWHGNKPQSGVAAGSREARYDLMTRWCVAHDVGRLYVAHTLDDQAETLIMRLARGSGVDGLSAMAPETVLNGVVLARPFLDVSRAQLQNHLSATERSWIDDPTNMDEAFERVRVRKALGVLDGIGVTARQIATSARRLQRARQTLETNTTAAMERHVMVHPAGYCMIAGDLVASETEDIVLRVLNKCLRAVGGLTYPPRQMAVEDLCAHLDVGGRQTHTLAGCLVSVQGQNVLIAREPGRMPAEPLPLNAGQEALWDGRFQVSYRAADRNADSEMAVTVRPLRRQGWDMMKQPDCIFSRVLRDGLVSFWRGDELLAVPHLAYFGDGVQERADFSAEFCNFSLLSGARVLSESARA